MISTKLTPRQIAEELLQSYWETLYYYDLAARQGDVEAPSAYHLFETIFDLVGIPSSDEFHRARIPMPNAPNDYWTRDELVKDFHRRYDDEKINDETLIADYLTMIEQIAGSMRDPMTPDCWPFSACATNPLARAANSSFATARRPVFWAKT